MKTAISIPDALFVRADKYAKEHSLSRSAMISVALDEFLKERQKCDLIERINQAVDGIGNDRDDAVIKKSKAMLRQLEW